MSTKKIVIVGAGYGGLEAAKTLHKRLRKRDDVEITLIDQNSHHTLLTELHEVAGHRIEPNGVQVSIEHVLEYTKVKFVQDRITGADLASKKLYSEKAEYSFDYLILGFGSEPAYYGISGMQEHSFTLWSLEDAKKIHNHIIEMFKKASEESNAEKRKELLTFVVGGGGFTGIEMMGELIEWTKTLCHEYGIAREEVQLYVIEALPSIMTILDDSLVQKGMKFLEKKGVKVLLNAPITEVTPDTVSMKDGQTIRTKTLIWTGGIQSKSFVKDFGISVGRRNRIIVNEHLQTKEYPYVYAIGDCMEFIGDDNQALPPLVETALQSGECAAENIAAEILGQEKHKLHAKLHGVMVSIGSLYGLAQLSGMPKMSGILAIFFKHLVNMHYLFGIGGLELVWEYINHQFLHKERKYNWFLETGLGHVGRRNFTFWLVPLRIWLGIMWLFSGLHKIQEGWWGATAIIGDATTNATSSASVMSLISDHTPGFYAWIVRTFIYPNPLFFQKMIVLVEIGLGLAFIFGAFTFLAAIVSIGMQLNFALSTGIANSVSVALPDLWWIFASFAMFAGAGRSFGVDYYLMPYLTHQLRYFQRNRSIHLLKGWKW